MVKFLAGLIAILGLVASACGSDSMDKMKSVTKPTTQLSAQGRTCGTAD